MFSVSERHNSVIRLAYTEELPTLKALKIF